MAVEAAAAQAVADAPGQRGAVHVQQAGQLPALFQEVRRGKGLADVVLEVTVKDADGNAVDTKALFDREDAGEELAEEAAAEEDVVAEAEEITAEADEK